MILSRVGLFASQVGSFVRRRVLALAAVATVGVMASESFATGEALFGVPTLPSTLQVDLIAWMAAFVLIAVGLYMAVSSASVGLWFTRALVRKIFRLA